MKKSSIYKLIISSSSLVLSFPILMNHSITDGQKLKNENINLKFNEDNKYDPKNSKIANEIIVENPDAVKSLNFLQVRDLLETNPMTQTILNRLSVKIPTSADPSLVSFTNINNGLFRVTFTIVYNGVPKSNPDHLMITPTNQEVANSIYVENPDALSTESNTLIQSLLENNPMSQEILTRLSVVIPENCDPTKVSFTKINIANPARITFTIRYNGVEKSTIDFLNAHATDKEIVDRISIRDNSALLDKTVTEIRAILETTPMTQAILNQLSIVMPEGIDVTKISFRKINITDPFLVVFEINYNGVAKDTTDFLNARLTDSQTVEATIVEDNNILQGSNINNIKGLLEMVPMTQEVLTQLSITIPKWSDPAKYSFKKIDDSNPFKIIFTISYNNVEKSSTDFLNATPTDKEVANASSVFNANILIGQNVNHIKNILETSPMTQEILDQLSVKIPLGSDPSKFSFKSIDISNLFKVTFKISYNNVNKDATDTLNATPTDEEVVEATNVENSDILLGKNVAFIKNILETTTMTQGVLNQLSVKIPTDSDPSKFSFTNINIENPFVITFTINYNNTPKKTSSTLNATPTNKEVANTIVIKNVDNLLDKKVIEIRNILETKPLTIDVLNQLSINLYEGVEINRITFTQINIENPLRITFVINYNGVAKDAPDFLNASATDLEIVNSIRVNDMDAVKDLNVVAIRNLLETSPMTVEVLAQLSIQLYDRIDIKKLKFVEINIDNFFKVTFKISYNGVSKGYLDFLNATPTNQDVANRISIGNVNILKDKNNDFVQALLQTIPMTIEVLNQLSVTIFEGVDPSKISFTNIIISNPLRVSFVINYGGVPKTSSDFLNTTQNDQEIANSIRVGNPDAVKGLRVVEIRNLLETKPLSLEVLNRLSINVPDGAQIFRISFTNINISNLFKITFTINYNNVAKSESSFLNATPSDEDVLNGIRFSNVDALINETRENIKAMLETNPMTSVLLEKMSISIPAGVDPAKISFTGITISNPLRVTFTINYNSVPKKTSNWFNTIATDLEIANVIIVTDVNVLKIENNVYIKSLLQRKQTPETLKQLSINFPEGADTSLISFSNIDITNPLKIGFTINYNNVPKATNDFLNSTPTEDIANAITIENQDVLKLKNVSYIENLMKTQPMTQAILNELAIKIPTDIPANRISFTNIDTSDLFAITFTINYNGVAKQTRDSLNATPTNQDIANAIIIMDIDIFKEKDFSYVKGLLETSPMTQEILDQLSIKIPNNIDPSKISFTNIVVDKSSKLTFTVNYNGIASSQETYFNIFVEPQSSNTVLIVSILVPISVIVITAVIGLYLWNKKKIDSSNNNNAKIKNNNKPLVVKNQKRDTKKPMNQPINNKGAQINKGAQSNQAAQSNQGTNQQGYEQWYYYNDQDNNQYYDENGNEQWYDEQGNLQSYDNQQQYDSQNPNDGQYYDEQGNEKWLDNKWYSNQGQTGQWLNGNWYEKENQKNQKNNKSNDDDDDWDEIIKQIEK